jgi:DNA-binding transcriptional MerR regulator
MSHRRNYVGVFPRKVAMVAEQSFSGKRAAEIVGITYRQLDYWARTDLVRPSLADAHGSGSRRRYAYTDLLELKVIKTLLDAGIRLESVREVFSYLREHLDEDIASANLVITGATPILVRSDGELIDLLRKGQGVLNVLPLAGVKGEVDAAIVDLPSRAGTPGAAAAGTAPGPVGDQRAAR